ncbi:uncharacterized protein ACOB8E_015697 isoform 1-T1 [Sarcophilus harrisii]
MHLLFWFSCSQMKRVGAFLTAGADFEHTRTAQLSHIPSLAAPSLEGMNLEQFKLMMTHPCPFRKKIASTSNLTTESPGNIVRNTCLLAAFLRTLISCPRNFFILENHVSSGTRRNSNIHDDNEFWDCPFNRTGIFGEKYLSSKKNLGTKPNHRPVDGSASKKPSL